MSHILVRPYAAPEDGQSFLDLRGHVVGRHPTSSKPRSRMLQRTAVRPEVAAKLAKRFGYPIEFWLHLGKPCPTRPNSLILPSDLCNGAPIKNPSPR
jgi:hypothetical protein